MTASNPLRIAVGITALAAPLIHSITDAMEWHQHGFSTIQLWLNYLAFVPMSWLLLGIYSVHDTRPNAAGLVGALLYGAAFTYFAHTTLYALSEHVPTYELLWQQLGNTYTVHGILMVCGGLLFGWSLLQAAWLPRFAILLFLAGILANLILGLLPAPDILQTVGSTARNLGLIRWATSFSLRVRPERPAMHRLTRRDVQKGAASAQCSSLPLASGAKRKSMASWLHWKSTGHRARRCDALSSLAGFSGLSAGASPLTILSDIPSSATY